MSYKAKPAVATQVSASISTPVRSAVRTVAVIDTLSGVQLQLHRHAVDGDRMAQRDQVRSALGGGDPGDPGHRQRIALGQAVRAQQADHLAVVRNSPDAVASRTRDVLARDIHHPGRAAGVEMRQFHMRQPTAST